MPFGKLGDGFGSTGGSGGGGTCCGIIVLDTGACSTVRCGVSNTASGTASAALGGYNNSASGQYSGIVAGFCNKATCYGAIVGGGGCNTASNVYAAIVSGNRSTITGSFSFIGSGQANTLSGNYSGILAGKNNNDCGFSNVNIIGSDIRANRACTSYVNDLEIVSLTSCSGCAVCVGTNGLLIGYTSPSLAGFVPYTGATSNVNLGTYSIASLNHIPGYTTTATAAGTTTLTVSSTAEQYFTGTTTQTVVLPVATTLVNGQQFTIVNNSTGVVTVQSSGLNTLQAMAAGTQLVLTMINTAGGTGTASWSWAYSYLASSVSTFSAGTTGFTPNTATGGAVTLAGTLAIANGGTNVTSVTVAPTATAFAGWDANKNLSANSLINGYATTATAAGTTTLFVGSAAQQYFTGSTTQTVVLPVATTLVNGQQFTITNNSTGVVTVQSSGLNTLQAMAAGTELIATLINTAGGTGTASWSWTYAPLNISAAAVTTFSAGTTGFTPNTATSGSIVLAGTLNVANGGTGVTTLAALASNSAFSSLYQGLNTNLTSLSGLTYASLSFVKMTAAGTFALDTNTYLTAGSAVSTFSAGTTGFTPNTATSGAIVLAGTLNVANGGTGVTTLAALASNSAFSSLYQGLNTNLTSLSGLTYASLSFVKMTAAGTFALDTNTYLTGNQTITLSSDVTGSGTTAITATISANAVTYAKFQQMAANTLHGNPTGSLANSQEITLGTGLSFSTTVLNLSTNLQSLSGLTYASTSFVKMTAAGTFALDTNTYLTSGTGVTTFSGGTTGLTPSSATSGAITLAGTLVAANGGTGYTSLASLAGDAAFTSAFQAKATNLTSLAGLSYASTSFVKMTAAGTFALDVNTYLTTSSASSTYLPLTGGTTTGNITSNVSNAAITVKAVGSTDAVYYDARNSAGTELFYLGLLNTSNYNVALMNEQAGSLSFGTTNGTRYTIDSSGNNTWTGSGTFGGSLTAGAISSSVSSGNNINLDKSGGAAINFTRSGVQHFLMEDDANGIGFYYGSSPTLGTTIGQNITTGGSITVNNSSGSILLQGSYSSLNSYLASITDIDNKYTGTPDGLGYEHGHIYFGRDGGTGANTYGSYLAFYTENKSSGSTDLSSEKVRISSAGYLLVGYTSGANSSLFQVNGSGYFNGAVTGAAASFTTGAFSVSGGTNQITLQTSGTDRAYIQANTANLIINSITSNPLLLQTNGTTALTINSSQNATFSGTVTATAGYNSSDKLLKNEVIRDLSDWRISNKISTVGYTWKDPKKGLGLRFGYYAQDLLPLIPEAVTKGDDGYYAVDYTMVHTVILDEHTIRIKQLEQEVASLKRRLGE